MSADPDVPSTDPGASPEADLTEGRGGVEATGDPRVDAAVARLDELDDAPTHEHVAIVEDVHRRLHDALADAASSG